MARFLLSLWMLAVFGIDCASARMPPASCDPVAAAASAAVPGRYMNPEIMAIGDSLYNGVESMSLAQAKVNFSVPYQVAKKLDLARYFNQPYYKYPLLIDLDYELRLPYIALRNLRSVMLSNIGWYADPAHKPFFAQLPTFFDNIAVAQADSVNLMCDVAQDADGYVNAGWATGNGNPQHIRFDIAKDAENWFYNLNSRFLLNPTQDSQYSHLSQLAEVLARKPKKLLVNVGANDGLWLMAFNGFGPQDCYDRESSNPAPCGAPNSTTVANELADYVSNMRGMGDMLSTLNREASHTTFYVNLLGAPSAAANLVPISNNHLRGDNRYYATYQNYLGLNGIRSVSGEKVKAMDALIQSVNSQVEQELCSSLSPRHVVFIDLFSLMAKYDAKNLQPNNGPIPAGSAVPVTVDTDYGPQSQLLDNRVISIDPALYSLSHNRFGLSTGGLFSADNMHPTAIGYAATADLVAKAARTSPAPTSSGECMVVAPDQGNPDVQPVLDALIGPDANSTLQVDTAVSMPGSGWRLLQIVHAYLAIQSRRATHGQTALAAQSRARPGEAGRAAEMKALFGAAAKSGAIPK